MKKKRFSDLPESVQKDRIYAALDKSESVTDACFELNLSWEYLKQRIVKLKINVGDKPWYFKGKYFDTFEQFKFAVSQRLLNHYQIERKSVVSFLSMDQGGLHHYYKSTASVKQYCSDALKRYELFLKPGADYENVAGQND